jgi:very-short-patch-repair endonuclease
MFVCSKRHIAYALWQEIVALRPEWNMQSPLPQGEGLGEGLGEDKETAIRPELIKLARKLRRNHTDAEKLLWQALRNRQIANTKFRRQHPLGDFILDFYCHEQKLAIELDGGQHFDEKQRQADLARTEALERLGIRVLRFDNWQMLQETSAVLEEIFKLGDEAAAEVDIFNDEYLARIEKIKPPNTRAKLLQQLLARAIEELKKTNKARGVDFSKQFQALVARYNERREEDVLVGSVVEEFTDEIINLLNALKREKESFRDLNIDFEEKAFYDILKAISIKYDFHYPEDKLIKLSRAIKAIVDDKARYTDWSRRDDIKAELKVDLILALAEHGYPPVANDEVYKDILEQAENFKKYREATRG